MCIAKEEEMTMEKKQARWIYKTMNEIRYFEEKVHKIFSDGQIPDSFTCMWVKKQLLQVSCHC